MLSSRVVVTGILAILATREACGADLPLKAPTVRPAQAVNWTGFYIGVHAGYSWGRWDGLLTYDPGTGPVQVFDPPNRTIDAAGWLGGGQIGFHYQLGSFVFGPEAEISWTNLKGGNTFSTIGLNNYTWNINNRLDWFGTVRGRTGIAVDRFLIYGTAGVAFGQAKANEVVTGFQGQGFPPTGQVTAVASTSENHIGWTAGGGVEWLLSRSLSIKVEYLYVDLGSASYRFTGTNFTTVPSSPHTTDSFPADLNFQIVRAGANYRF
jgi:outer membrane immunogenic protein